MQFSLEKLKLPLLTLTVIAVLGLTLGKPAYHDQVIAVTNHSSEKSVYVPTSESRFHTWWGVYLIEKP